MSVANFRFFVILLCTLALASCSSDNNTSTTLKEVPVTGEFHHINPADISDYVATFEAQQSRTAYMFDGVQHNLVFEEIDSEDDWLITSYENHFLFIGFDSAEEEPLPKMKLLELDGESVVRELVGESLTVEITADDDFSYSGRLSDSTTNAEFDVTLLLNDSLVTAGSSTLAVTGTDATLNGTLGTGTYIQMRDMIAANPAVNRLIIHQSDGSVNDAINMHTARLVRAANLATHVPADGDINSGAVDMFAAGVSRTVEPGGILGVHSWCCENGVAADKLPISDDAHGPQLTYFREVLPETGVDFYFFTLRAASADAIYPMTREEMTKYKLVTE